MLRNKGKYLLAIALCLLALFGCKRGGKVISEKKFSEIYADMFLADQWLRENSRLRHAVDTVDFYGAIFSKYGCTFEDYDKSVNHYLSDPEEYAKIIEKASDILEARIAELEKIKAAQQAEEDFMRTLPPYESVDFKQDTILRIDNIPAIYWEYAPRRDSVRTDPQPKVGELPGDKPLTLEGEAL